MSKRYRLHSTSIVFTPGLLQYVRRMDHKNAKNLLPAAFPELPETAIDKLLAGDYLVEGEDVIVEIEDD